MDANGPSSARAPFDRTRARSVAISALVGVVAFALFGFNLSNEPHFVDESAYYSQSGYADLLTSDRDNGAWLDYAGYDLPPLPKYLIGGTLRLFGYPRPTPRTAWEWYANTSRRFETVDSLTAARWPSVLLGALGCLAIYWLGRLVLDWRLGLISSCFLMINPLYRLHSRRAMSDVPAEAFLILALVLGAAAWLRFVERRQTLQAWLIALGSGMCVGLSVLSKLNGTIAALILTAWAVLGLLLLAREGKRPDVSQTTWSALSLLLAMACAGVVSFATFVLLNPFLTAHPTSNIDPRLAEMARKSFVERVLQVADHRIEASRAGQRSFPDDALISPIDKVKAVAVQGFGRFGPFGPAHSDSRIRFDRKQDWGAWIWGPLVLLGFGRSIALGKRALSNSMTPRPWLVAVQSAVALVAVTLYVPLAWDRYFISIQPGSCLLASVALVGLWDAIRGRLKR